MSALEANNISRCSAVASCGIVMNSSRLSFIAISKVPDRGFQRPGLTLVQFAADEIRVSFDVEPNLDARPPSLKGWARPPLGRASVKVTR